MINTSFQRERTATAVEGSSQWDLLYGSTGALVFGTDNSRVKVGISSTGTHAVHHTTKPKTAAQRREGSRKSDANVGAELWFDYLTNASYQEQVLGDNPVGYWRLNETSGSAADLSVNNKSGSVTGTGTVTQGVTGLLTGSTNKAASFANPGTNRIAVNDDPVFTNGTVTVECWVKVNTFPTGTQRRWVVNKWVSPNIGFILEAYSGGWRFIVGNGTTSVSATNSSGANTSAHHVVGTFDGTTAKVYVDGVAGTSASFGSATTIPDNAATVQIGGSSLDVNFGSDATVDEVAIYNGALLPARITAHYQTGTGSGSILATLATTSIVLQGVDASNQVLLKAYHTGSKQCEIVEVVGGVSTILGTLNHLGTNTGMGAIRLEVVGKQARAWFDSGSGYVIERPPDKVVTLSQAYQGSYEWGFAMSIDILGGSMWVKRFIARDLPTGVPAPPYFTVESASTYGFNFTPITATVASVSGSAREIQWEVAPADSNDIPDPYKDVAPASVTTRVFWVRPGYSYTVRAREVNHDGTFGTWVSFAITAAGTKAFTTPLAASLPADKFLYTPDYTMSLTHKAEVHVSTSDTGHEVTAMNQVRPRRTFTFTFANKDSGELKPIIEFFARVRGKQGEFYWDHPTTGESIPLRFDDDDLKLEWKERDSVTGLDVGDLEITATEIVTGVVETLAFNLSLDAAYY